jgi:hypothetical protein
MSEIVIEGIEQLLKAFDDLAGELKNRSVAAVGLAANAYKNDVQAKITEIGLYKTGDYRRSWHVEPGEDSDGTPFALAGTDNIAAKQHEFGGVIKAKNGPYLTFRTEDGNWHKVPFVTQPAHPHARPVLDATKDKYQDIIVTEMFK